MKPLAYLDIKIRSAATTGQAQFASAPHMAYLVWVLHGVITNEPNCYALAFPQIKTGKFRHPGNTVRVFAEASPLLEQLSELLKANPRLAEVMAFGKPALVPENFAGPWREYRKFRVPGRSSRLEESRNHRLEMADQLPHFRVRSKTNQQGFVLFIEPRDVPAELISTDYQHVRRQPDGYGLSVYQRSFALPVIE